MPNTTKPLVNYRGTVPKASLEQEMGITFNNREEKILISNIAVDSPFAGTDLEKGFAVQTVNGKTVTSASDATQMVNDAIGSVTIIARG